MEGRDERVHRKGEQESVFVCEVTTEYNKKNSAYLEATYEGKQVCLRLGKHRCKTYLTENFYQNS